MGGCHFDPWLQSAIPTPATSFTPGQDDCHQRPGESTSTGPGAFRPLGQGCHRGSRSSAATQRLLFDVLPRAKKDRRISSNFRFEGSQPVSEGAPFSHAYHSGGSPDCGKGRLVYVNRPYRCLLSCAHCSGTPALSQVRLSGSPLAIPGAAVRPLPIPKGVYPMREGGSFTPAGLWGKNFAVSRRLAGLRPLSTSCGSGHRSSSCSCVPVGLQGEFSKELPDSVSDGNFSRHGVGHDLYEGSSVRSPGGRHPPVGRSVQAGEAIALCRLPAVVGQTDVSHSRCAIGLAVSAPSSEVAEQFSPGRQTAQASRDCSVMDVSSCPGSMEGQGVFVQGCPHGVGGISQRGGHDRCQLYGLGCCVATPHSSRPLESTGSLQAHKCARATGCTFGSEALSAPPGGKACADSVGQHISCLPHQPSGGHQVSTAAEGVQRPFGMGPPSFFHPASNVFAWGAQPGRRLSLSPGACSGRMVSSQRRGGHDLGPLRSGRGRFVRLRGVDSLSRMVFPHREVRCAGPGCAGSSLASGPSVCVSAPASDLAYTTESSDGGPQAVAGSPLLASAAMVPIATESVSQRSVVSSEQERPTVSVEGTDMAPQSSTFPAVGLATGGSAGQLIGVSDPVRHTILSARASSTRLQYENRWRLFSRWCSARDVDPLSCSVSSVLEFLQSLLDGGRSPSTLKVYVAAISCHHSGVDGRTMGSHNLVSLFLRGARRLRPPSVLRAPVWDLPLVLDSLCRPPFEPLAQADLKWLSCKTAFLLAIVSAKRVGELHALSVSPSCLRWSPDGTGVTLWPNTAFVPKVLSRSHCNQPLRLARFQPPSGVAGDGSELLCPVRALEAYVAATAGMRRSDQLFLCYGGPKVGCPLSKQRLSHWLVDVICHAYSAGGCALPVGVKAHSTRSVSTSWAAMRGVPLDTICAAASWASPSTFTRFYNVNVADPHPLGQALLQGSSGSSQ